MPRGAATKGRCAYCEEEFAGSGMKKHLQTCAQRLAAIAKAEKKSGKPETLHHLRAQSADNKSFWLDLEMRGTATLADLDQYLRAIWLECCGHLSQFSVGGWDGAELGKQRKIEDVFRRGVKLTHIYDFGTSSTTQIEAVEKRTGKPTTQKPIALMARNARPEARCLVCKKPAEWLCLECMIEEDRWGALCEAHVDEHVEEEEHGNYGDPIPLVNSPRVGMCGYTGPADPPY